MANQLGTNPWVIDTAGAAILHAGWCFITAIVWTNYANPADQAIIAGSQGPNNVSFNALTLTGKQDLSEVKIEPAKPIRIRDFAVPTLGSGKLQIFLE